jgi:hypothetical protein
MTVDGVLRKGGSEVATFHFGRAPRRQLPTRDRPLLAGAFGCDVAGLSLWQFATSFRYW